MGRDREGEEGGAGGGVGGWQTEEGVGRVPENGRGREGGAERDEEDRRLMDICWVSAAHHQVVLGDVVGISKKQKGCFFARFMEFVCRPL